MRRSCQPTRILRRRHPKLEIESCASSGGRTDLGILHFTDEVWPSDNTDALGRLLSRTASPTPSRPKRWRLGSPMFQNYLDRRTASLQCRFPVAMQGALGIATISTGSLRTTCGWQHG
ncbi:MAG: alpha-galactosidase [Janthinobacterium lividum]